MNFVRRWIKNWMVATLNSEEQTTGRAGFAIGQRDSVTHNDDFEHHRDMFRFNVQPARGGIIVTVRKYDHKSDDTHHTVHIIHDDQDVAQNIAHIVSMELLRG